MTIKHLFPPAFPKLDLNFAAERTLDPRITFTRSSIGTYTDATGIIRYAAEDEPRFDHSSTGKSLGLLIEESRTNLCDYSEDFTTWFHYGGASTSVDGTLAPDNIATATKLLCTGTTKTVIYARSETGVQVRSFFAKAGSTPYVFIDSPHDDPGVWFDLSTGNVQGTGASIVPLGNGWYRCIVATNFSNFFAIGPSNSMGTDSTSIGHYLYIWGAQGEEGSFPTSYIPTNGSRVTRAADICSIEGDNVTDWYNDPEGTFFYERVKQNTVANQQELWIYPGPGFSQSNKIAPTWKTTQVTELSIQTANVNQPSSSALNTADKVAFALKNNDTALATGGVLGNVVTSNLLPGPIDRISVRHGTWIKRLSYYSRRLSDEQLQALTS